MKIDLNILNKKPDYEGSVQYLYFLDDDKILCKTTTGGSVFDVGTIFYIPDNDIFRTAIRHKIYTGLAKREFFDEIEKYIKEKNLIPVNILKEIILNGVKTHHIGIVDNKTGEVYKDSFPQELSNLIIVKKFNILKPILLNLNNQALWNYHKYHLADNYVIPLENIIRFGITPQSSVFKRYKKSDEEGKKKILKEFGVEVLYEWQIFDRPIIDFTTKYEPQDRAVTYQEACNIAGVDEKIFEKLYYTCLFCAVYVFKFFERLELTLWDLKLEFAFSNNELYLVDTIDTDSVRITKYYKNKFIHFNKQAVRDFYLKFHKDWIDKVNKAKEEAKKKGIPFQNMIPTPPEIDKNFLELQSKKLKYLVDLIIEGKSNIDIDKVLDEEITIFK